MKVYEITVYEVVPTTIELESLLSPDEMVQYIAENWASEFDVWEEAGCVSEGEPFVQDIQVELIGEIEED